MSDEIDQLPEIPATASAIAPGTIDRQGTPFDPARHIPKMHPLTGRWMPKGGRKPKNASTASVSVFSASVPTDTPLKAITPTADSSPPTAARIEPSAAPSLADIERAANAPAPAEAAQAAEKVEDARAVMVDAAEAQASTIWKCVYAVTGGVTGAPEESTRTGAAHANLCSALSAWMVESNIRIKGVWGLIIAVVCYFAETGTKPKTRAWIDRMADKWGKKKTGPIQAASLNESSGPLPTSAAPITTGAFGGLGN
jgi:hypothetical protein